MKEVIPPIDKDLIEAELTEERFLRTTNKANNKLYIINHFNAPNVLKEVGRLREITFREAGGGTGKDCDLDHFDVSELPYEQLVVWDPTEREILGGYRYILGSEICKTGNPLEHLATSKLFHFSDKFNNEYLPYTIELGRSFVQPAYQSTQKGKKSLFALDNLWDGLGAIQVNNNNHKYFFGKVTMYTKFDPEARNLILYFLNKHFGDKESLVYPKDPLHTGMDKEKMGKILYEEDFLKNQKILSQEVRARGEVIPPLINAYINLSPTPKCFGTVINDGFGGVEETALLLTTEDMYEAKTKRHIESYIEQLNENNLM